jgi:phosphoglycerol transferase MdoB-like AlkP superfamily enzyme
MTQFRKGFSAGVSLRIPPEGFTSEIILYAFFTAALVLKSIVLTGAMMYKNHAWLSWNRALDAADPHLGYYILPCMMIMSLAFFFPGSKRLLSYIILDAAVSAFFTADILYFRSFSTLPTPVILHQTANLENLSSSVFGMMRPMDILFFADIIIASALFFKLRKITADRSRPAVAVALLIAAAWSLLSPVYKEHKRGNNIIAPLIDSLDQAVTAFNLSPLLYHAYSIYEYNTDCAPLTLSADDKAAIERWLDEKNDDSTDSPYAGMFKGKNAILIQFESLENFVIGKKAEGQEITPVINSLLKNALYFSDYHEQVREGNSSDAEFLSNASMFPLRQGSVNFMFPGTPYSATMPKLFRKKGYSALAAHADHGSFWNWRASLSNLGYTECIDVSKFTVDEFLIFGISDRSYLRQMVPVISERKKPFLTYLATLSSHIPFKMPDTHKGLRLSTALDNTRLGGYFQSMHYTDAQLGMFFKMLSEKGILDDTVIVLWGDHEGIHKYYPDEIEKIRPREDWWYRNGKRVPLVIYYKGLKGRVITTAGGEVDLLPTIAHLFALDEKKLSRRSLGRNLLSTKKNYVLDSNDTVYGTADPELVRHAKEGMAISDKIIRSGYFGK